MPNIVWVPPEPPERQYMHDYLFECSYWDDVSRFKELLERSGANFIAIHDVPFWNVYRQVVNRKFLVVYQHTEELSMEVLT